MNAGIAVPTEYICPKTNENVVIEEKLSTAVGIFVAGAVEGEFEYPKDYKQLAELCL